MLYVRCCDLYFKKDLLHYIVFSSIPLIFKVYFYILKAEIRNLFVNEIDPIQKIYLLSEITNKAIIFKLHKTKFVFIASENVVKKN